jgi:serine/threonine-protein kinase mTOR
MADAAEGSPAVGPGSEKDSHAHGIEPTSPPSTLAASVGLAANGTPQSPLQLSQTADGSEFCRQLSLALGDIAKESHRARQLRGLRSLRSLLRGQGEVGESGAEDVFSSVMGFNGGFEPAPDLDRSNSSDLEEVFGPFASLAEAAAARYSSSPHSRPASGSSNFAFSSGFDADSRIGSVDPLPDLFGDGPLAEITPLDLGATAEIRKDIVNVVSQFVLSSKAQEIFAGVLAVHLILDAGYANDDKTFANNLRVVLTPTTRDESVLQLAASGFGRLARSEAVTGDMIDMELSSALVSLRDGGGTSDRYRRYACLLELRELGISSPVLFNTHVGSFVEAIWAPLRDSHAPVRAAALAALRVCLSVISAREHAMRLQWYGVLRDHCNAEMATKESKTPYAVRSAILVVGQLLENSGDFMEQHFDATISEVLKFCDSKHGVIRGAVAEILPHLARFSPEVFAKNHLTAATNFLLSFKREKKDDSGLFGIALLSVGQVSAAVGAGHIKLFLEQIVGMIRAGFVPPKKRSDPAYHEESMQCTALLAGAIGTGMRAHVQGLLDDMFVVGVSDCLTSTLSILAARIPALESDIQQRLLSHIATQLGHPPLDSVMAPDRRMSMRRMSTASDQLPQVVASPVSGSITGVVEVLQQSNLAKPAMALRTLAAFDFASSTGVRRSFDDFLSAMMSDCVVHYLSADDIRVRHAAVQACVRHAGGHERRRGNRHAVAPAPVISGIVEQLVRLGVTDTQPSMRRVIFDALAANPRFDDCLALPHNVRSLFMAVNDGEFGVREQAIAIIGRLTLRNPSFVLPSLRKLLVQLLSDLQYAGQGRLRRQSARLLAQLVRSSSLVVRPYIQPFLAVLTPLLSEAENSRIRSDVLSALGHLSLAATVQLRPHLPQLFSVILNCLRPANSVSLSRRAEHSRVALRVLSQLVVNTGYSTRVLFEYPSLLPNLLQVLHGSARNDATLSRAVVRALGVVGALDPVLAKPLLAGRTDDYLVSGEEQLATGRVLSAGSELARASSFAVVAESSQDVHFPRVVIHALSRILTDPAAASLHRATVTALTPILKSLSPDELGELLPFIMSPILQILHRSSDLDEFIIGQLGVFISFPGSGYHFRPYMDELFQVILATWAKKSALIPTLCGFLRDIAGAFGGEFSLFLPQLLHPMLQVLRSDDSTNFVCTREVLKSLETFGFLLDDYLHLFAPAIVRLIALEQAGPSGLSALALQTLRRLSETVHLGDHAASIIHLVTRLLDGISGQSRDETFAKGYVAQVQNDIMDVLCTLVVQLGQDFAMFIAMVSKVLVKHGITHERYDELVTLLVKNQPLEDAPSIPMGQSSAGVSKRPNLSVQLAIPEENLRRVWKSHQRITDEDWRDWIQRLAVTMLQFSPRPTLRSIAHLAQEYQPLLMELFNAAFIACWMQLQHAARSDLIRNLEGALRSPNLPPDVLHVLLNLAEFMEYEQQALPLDVHLLGSLAQRNRAYAKALHYKEKELEQMLRPDSETDKTNVLKTIEETVSLNNNLGLHDSAMGLLQVARRHISDDDAASADGDVGGVLVLDASWYEEMFDWQAALELHEEHNDLAGQVRCLSALGDWSRVTDLSNVAFDNASAELGKVEDDGTPDTPRRHRRAQSRRIKRYALSKESATSQVAAADVLSDVAPFAMNSLWRLGRWDELSKFLDACPSQKSFYLAALAVRQGDEEEAQSRIAETRALLEADLPTLVGESYPRAYTLLVRAQQLVELEEVVRLRAVESSDVSLDIAAQAKEQRELLRQVWAARLRDVEPTTDTWSALLDVRSLLWDHTEDPVPHLKFVRLCRRRGNTALAKATLNNMLGSDPEVLGTEKWTIKLPDPGSCHPAVSLEYLSHQWEAASSLGTDTLCEERRRLVLRELKKVAPSVPEDDAKARARVYRRIGEWDLALARDGDAEGAGRAILRSFKTAIKCDDRWYAAWHGWALANFHMLKTLETSESARRASVDLDRVRARREKLAVAAIEGFFRSSMLRPTRSLQDTLRLLTLWFEFGHEKQAKRALQRGFESTPVSTWLQVIPQLIARITTPNDTVRRLVIRLLIALGTEHPQALVFPMTVCLSSDDVERVRVASLVTSSIRQHSGNLMSEAVLVADELNRVSILWHEMWYYALEEASRMHFTEKAPARAIARLSSLHAEFDAATADLAQLTQMEMSFFSRFASHLREAAAWTERYQRTSSVADLDQAWDLYYDMFRELKTWLRNTRRLELRYVSPLLGAQRNLSLAVPGTYSGAGAEPDEHAPSITQFDSTMEILATKQRPRKMMMRASDGAAFAFLLKGHEDLRQDERVMQLFGLVNTLLRGGWETSRRDLSIQRYSVVPISANSGLMGWVPQCDTLQALIRAYRDAREIPLMQEEQILFQISSDFKSLSMMQKVESFQAVLDATDGQDLKQIMSLQTHTGESWLEHRTTFVNSLAVMSMVGHVLGLGDRHCNNLMIQRGTGKVVHIDFGDCFEVAMARVSFPEKMPFRLTRMLVNAMGVGGIEGPFTKTCESVMSTLRQNGDSLMAVLEAFVYDPLISWRLLADAETGTDAGDDGDDEDDGSQFSAPKPRLKTEAELGEWLAAAGATSNTETSLPPSYPGDLTSPPLASSLPANMISTLPANTIPHAQVLNARAISVTQRIQAKLTGRDFNTPDQTDALTVPQQVQRLIQEATSTESLATAWLGWSPYW